MTPRLRTLRAVRKPQRRVRTGSKSAKAPLADPLDAFIAAGTRSLGVKIEKSWLPAVRLNLAVTLRHGALVAEFPLPDEAEPAPVFRT